MAKFLSIFLLSISLNNFSQNSGAIESILQMERTQIVQLEEAETNTITYLPSEFAEDVLSAEKYNYLHNATIVKVYYVYTQYKLNASFDQLTLDRKRFRLLDEHFPEIIENPIVEWQILEQTGCKHYNEGDDYFHGFVIVHRPILSPEEMEEARIKEIEKIDAYFENPVETFEIEVLDPVEKSIETTSLDSVNKTNTIVPDTEAKFYNGDYALYEWFRDDMVNCEEVGLKRQDIWVDFSFEVDTVGNPYNISFNGEYSDNIKDQMAGTIMLMPDWIPASKNGQKVNSTVNLKVRVSYSRDVKGIYTRDGYQPVFTAPAPEIELPTAPTHSPSFNKMENTEAITVKTMAVYKGMELISEEQRLALVMDVTGSMAGQIAAMMNWIKTNLKAGVPFTSYTFFNDGDNKETKKKKIGQTGGIYMTTAVEEINKTIKKTMKKGYGGERPENDIEAVIYATDNDLEADAVLLIGDNYSEVRDLELLKKIDVPVHVILCSAQKSVRSDYLQIAKETGGMFILNGKSIDLSGLVKGEKIFIQGIEYKYTEPEFKNLGEK